MLLKKRIIILFIGVVFFLTGCFNDYSKESSVVKVIAKTINEDLLLLEESIEKNGKAFEGLEDIFLTKEELLKISEQYEKTLYGLYYNQNTIHSSGILTGYKYTNSDLKNRLFKTERLENILIEAYNNHAIIDQAYYIEGSGLLRIYPSIRVTDNLFPKTNFFESSYFEQLENNNNDVLKWFTVPFLNSSGRNWGISLFNPIYRDGIFQGVLGYDIVTSNFETHYLEKDMLLINRAGDIISIDPSLYQVLNIDERENDIYYEIIMDGKLSTKDFNLNTSKTKSIRELYLKVIKDTSDFTLELEKDYFVISEKIEVIDGYLIKLIAK